MENFTRIIGDVHQKQDAYVRIANKAPYSVQIGDLGFRYETVKEGLDPDKHMFFAGNHDNFDLLTNCPPKHYLGRYGMTRVGQLDFYWIGGGHSIDRRMRTTGIDWWPNEELGGYEIDKCIQEYSVLKPEVVLSHECPVSISDKIGDPGILRYFGYHDGWHSYTAQFLEACFSVNQPKLWIHGHFHLRHETMLAGCKFIGLGELDFVDIDPITLETSF